MTASARQWEVFKGKYSRLREPAISVHPNGTLVLNRSAAEALGHPARVSLVFDAEEGLIGVTILRGDDPGYALRANGQIAARALLRRMAWEPTEVRRYEARWYDDVLAISLQEPGTVVTRMPKSESA